MNITKRYNQGFLLVLLFTILIFMQYSVTYGQWHYKNYRDKIQDTLEQQEYNFSSYNDTGFSVLGRWAWGPCLAVALTGNYALVGQGMVYQVYDITNPSIPQLLYDTTLSGVIMDIKIRDSLLFIFLPYDIVICKSNSLFPLIEIGRCSSDGGSIRDASVSDSILFFIAQLQGLVAVDISDPSNPYITRSISLGFQNPLAIASKAKYVYYGPGGPALGLAVLEYKPDSAFNAKQIDVEGNASAVYVQDTLLFVGNNTKGKLFVMSITDPWNPRTLDTINLHSPIFEISANRENVYCSTRDSGIIVINSSYPDSLYKVTTCLTCEGASKLSCSSSILAEAGGINLRFNDISKQDTIELKSSIPMGGYYYDIVAKGHICFVASIWAGVWSIDFSNPSHPRSVSNLRSDHDSYSQIFMKDSLLFIVGESLVTALYDKNGFMTRLATTKLNHSGFAAIQDTLMFFTSDSAIDIVSIADPYHPRLITSWYLYGRDKHVSASGNYLAVTCRAFNQGFRMLDISDPANPQLRSYIEMDPVGVLLEDSVAFVAASELIMFNVSNPDTPIIISSVFSPSNSYRSKLYHSGNLLYNVGAQVRVLDISDLTQPFEVASLLQYTFPYGVAISHDTLYVATSNYGVWALKNNSITLVADDCIILPKGFELMNNYPNPFNPSTIISYSLFVNSVVSLNVYNLLGEEVATLVNEKQYPGIYNTEFNAEGLPSGIYLFRLTVGTYSTTKKLLLIK